MRHDAVAEPRNCRLCFLLAAEEKGLTVSLLSPAGQKWCFCFSGGDSEAHLVLLRTIFFSLAEGRCCCLCFMDFT